MAYGDFKDLASGKASTKIFRNKAYNIAMDPKCGGDQRSLAAIVYKFFNKKSGGSGVNMYAVNKTKHNHQLAEELHKPVINKLKKRTVFFKKRRYLGCWFSWYAINKQV